MATTPPSASDSPPDPIHAVLTGDLVRSSALSDDAMARAREIVLATVAEVAGLGWDAMSTNTSAPGGSEEAGTAPLALGRRPVRAGSAEFFRGDSWQCLLVEPRWALRVAVLVRVTLLSTLKVDTRVSIGIGAVETVSPDRISLSRGEAFTLSGEGLDRKMGARYRLAISIPEAWDHPTEATPPAPSGAPADGAPTRAGMSVGTSKPRRAAREGGAPADRASAVTPGPSPAPPSGANAAATSTALPPPRLGLSAAWLDTVARLCDSVIGQWQGRQLEIARLLCLHPEGITQAEIAQRLDPPVTQQAVAKTMQNAGWYGLQDALDRFESETWTQP